MIERQFVAQKIKEFQVQEYIRNTLKRVGHSHTKLQKTPLGEKIVIYAMRPGLVVGKKGQNIKKLTNTLKRKFNLENPQIEIAEVDRPGLDANIIAEKIAESLEKFGAARFKGIAHSAMEETVTSSGGLGIEILISGKIPSSRAKTWRFYTGYLKKSGDIAQIGVKKAYTEAQLKTGTVGVQVRIMPPDIQLPDDIEVTAERQVSVEEVNDGTKAAPENVENTANEEVVSSKNTNDESKEEKKPKKKKAVKKQEKTETKETVKSEETQ